MQRQTSFTFLLTPDQQGALMRILREGNYRPREVPHTTIAAAGDDFNVALFKSGKCLVQGKGAHDWVLFTLEPLVLGAASLGYEKDNAPERFAPHAGIDESGKGDFFGPLVIAAAYVDEAIASDFDALGVRDSKNIGGDRRIRELAQAIRERVKDRWALVAIGPEAYNRLYTKMGNVNRILAWGHARAIENLLEKVPDCPRALADQFGPTDRIEKALLQKGRKIKLEQRPKAESDPAVAAASILARHGFVDAMDRLGKQAGLTLPRGASAETRKAAVELVRAQGPDALVRFAKCHFKTADAVLEEAGHARSELGPNGQAVSQSFQRFTPRRTPA